VPSPITLQLITPDLHPAVERLWQLYQHDMSEFRDTYPSDEGLFKAGRLPLFLTEADKCGYLVRYDGRLAGFAFVRGLAGDLRVMGEFFIVRAARRQKVGRETAVQVLRRHPGDWEIAFQEENPGAARFWRRLVRDLVGSDYLDQARPVPGKPNIPPDTWLSFRA
jgi:predicted acetyltransferase